jgi:hypothetical protein
MRIFKFAVLVIITLIYDNVCSLSMQIKTVLVAVLLLTVLAAALPAKGQLQTHYVTEDPNQITARDMAEVLESEAVTWAQAAHFVLAAVDIPAANAPAAFEAAKTRGWLPGKAEARTGVDFGGFSFLLMQAFDIPGGLMYRLFPNPRYAYRELVHKGIVQGQHDQSQKVSGFWLLTVIGRVLEESGEEE